MIRAQAEACYGEYIGELKLSRVCVLLRPGVLKDRDCIFGIFGRANYGQVKYP